MRHILVIMALIVAAWVILPGAAQAHDMPHGANAVAQDACPDCPMMDHAKDPVSAHDCHEGTSCAPAVHAIATGHCIALRAEIAVRSMRPDLGARLRSTLVAEDLPPPRA